MMDIDRPEDEIPSTEACSNCECASAKDDRSMEEGTLTAAVLENAVDIEIISASTDGTQLDDDVESNLGLSWITNLPSRISSRFLVDSEESAAPTPMKASSAKNGLGALPNQTSGTSDNGSETDISGAVDTVVVSEEGFTDNQENRDVAPEESSPQSLSEVIAALQKARQAAGTVCDTHQECTAIERRVRDFERARWMRFDAAKFSPPWGILGLFHHLAGVRADLKWAEYAAYRRSRNQPYAAWADYIKAHDHHRRPYFIIFLFLASTVMMFYTMYLSDWKFAPLNINPMIGPSPEALIEAGALSTNMIVVHGEWYRLFAPLVLHAGIIHYMFNMLAIWFIGIPLEKLHGFAYVSCLFIMSAVGGNILSAVFQPNAVSVGASGGIFGMIGVCLADIAVNRDLLFLKVDSKLKERSLCYNFQVLVCLFFDMFINIAIGLTPYVDNFAHGGGLLYGILFALPLADKLDLHFFGRESACNRLTTVSLRLFGISAGLCFLIASSVMLRRSDGTTNPCERCRFISCAPFPPWKENKWWDCSIS